MKILHFYKNMLPETIGGVEQVIDQISRGTAALGVENTVLSLSNSPVEKSIPMHGYKVFTVKRNFTIASNGFSWQSVHAFKKLAAEVDLIHYHFPWPFMDMIHQWVKPKKPTVVTYHSDIIRQKLLLKLYRPLKRQFLKSADHIVATSPNYFLTSNVLQDFSGKTSVIPIGLDPNSYPSPNLDQIRFYQSHFGERFYLFIGAFRYYKGLEFLIQAAKSAQFPIVISGSGKTEKDLKVMVHQLQLKNVFFVGQISDTNRSSLLAACYSVILPSHLRSEAFGVTLLEGAMFGKPLISCEIATGTSYININQITGLVAMPADPTSLSEAMTWLWNHPERAKAMGESARIRFEALFTSTNMAQSYFELYQNLINR